MIRSDCLCRFAMFAELGVDSCSRAAAAWLSPAEQARWSGFRSADRRLSWLAGRVLAKQMLLDQLPGQGIGPTMITIVSHRGDGRGASPRVQVRGKPIYGSLSISHTGHGVAVAWSAGTALSVGIDLAVERTVSPGFCRLWFSDEECRLAGSANWTPMSIWAAKEAVFKACNRGEAFAPGRVGIRQSEDGLVRSMFLGRELGTACRVQLWHAGGQVGAIAVLDMKEFVKFWAATAGVFRGIAGWGSQLTQSDFDNKWNVA